MFDFLTSEFGFPASDILLFGRSIGSGPATYLASQRRPGLLALMSPFRCISDVVETMVGKFGRMFVAN